MLSAAGCSYDSPSAPELTRVGVSHGLAAPESAFFDEETRSWFVSNMGMIGMAGDGFVSRLHEDGSIEELIFISGLDDPKGIRVHAGVLYVSDNDQLVRAPVDAPEQVERIAVPGAMFLNDVAVDRTTGDVYVSDSFGDAIYRLRGSEVSLVVRTAELETPNGLLLEDGDLLIASIGPDPDPIRFETSAPGRVLRLNLRSLDLATVTARLGLLDGLEQIHDGLMVSDLTGVYWVDANGEPTRVLDNAEAGLGSSGDIGVAHPSRTLAIPEWMGTRVFFYTLSWPP